MKQTIEKDIKFSRLAENENYFKYIFKKTEKIVAASIYIINHVDNNSRSASLLEDFLTAAKQLHAISLDSLQHFEHAADEILMKYSHALVALESTAQLCVAGGLITPSVMQVLSNEIDAVHRGLQNRYMIPGTKVVFSDAPAKTISDPVVSSSPGTESVARVARPVAPAARSDSPASASGGNDRRARIFSVIESRGEVTIKDISAVVSDVSEKTIQRELNAMIEDNMIRRIGEKRWSRYTVG